MKRRVRERVKCRECSAVLLQGGESIALLARDRFHDMPVQQAFEVVIDDRPNAVVRCGVCKTITGFNDKARATITRAFVHPCPCGCNGTVRDATREVEVLHFGGGSGPRGHRA